MRQRYLTLLTLFASLPAGALTFQTRMENIAWKVEGDPFECRLIQPIEGFGSGEFVRRAGEQPVFQLRSDNNVLGAGTASLLAAAARGSLGGVISTWATCGWPAPVCCSVLPKARPAA